MARISVDEVQSRVASITDQDENTANLSSTDYSLRLKYINMAQKQWAEANDWRQLFTEYNMLISTSTGNASIALPTNFKKLAGYPLIVDSNSTTHKLPEVRPEEDNQYVDTDKRMWLFGSPADGYILRVFGMTLSSGASLKVPYYRSRASLASPANIADVPNVDYLIQRTVAFIWESREDGRFPGAKAEAERILSNMIEYENVFSRAATYDRVKTYEETRSNFRWGRDG